VIDRVNAAILQVMSYAKLGGNKRTMADRKIVSELIYVLSTHCQRGSR
jgi:hypothetical protein